MIPTTHLTSGFVDGLQATWDSTKSTLMAITEFFVPEAVPFSKSVIGSKVVHLGKGVASDFVGATVGAFFPEGMLGYSATQIRGWSRTASGVAGVAAILFSKSITFVTGYSLESGLLTTAATIAGGFEGRKMAGVLTPAQSFSDTYAVRSLQGVVVRGAVQIVREAMPIPAGMTTLTSAIGGAFQMLAGTVGVFAQEIERFTLEAYDRPPRPNHLFPDRVVRTYAVQSSGNTYAFVEEMMAGLEIPFLNAIQKIIGRSIDRETGVKVFVRSLNQYVRSHNNPGYLNQIMSWAASYVMSPEKISQTSEKLCEILQKREIDMIGFQWSNRSLYKPLLDHHLSYFLPLLAYEYTKSGLKNIIRSERELEQNEVIEFYQNMHRIGMSAFGGGVARISYKIIHAMIPSVIRSDRFAPVGMDWMMHQLFHEKPVVQVIEDQVFEEPRVIPAVEVKSVEIKKPIKSLSRFRRFISFIFKVVAKIGSKVLEIIESPKPQIERKRHVISKADFLKIEPLDTLES